MTPAPGQTLLQYRLIEQIGEGGMGVVWRATDTALGRDAAIKILPDQLSADPDRLARFEREAKLLASLSHPNIAAVYGLHTVDGLRFLSMEMVNGEDLAERLSRGPIPIDEAIVFARQIAEALETAHENGIIHRDLKPANVRVTPGGQIKVLDFGLAKAFETQAGSSSGSGPSMLSPTVTSMGTVAGLILGTAAYMSPEQARGKPVDRRTDIWAFGCVTYEMLTRKRPFDGETVSDSIGKILQTEVDLSALPPGTPRAVRDLIVRCLVKDPKQRLRDIGDARIALEHVADAPEPPSLATAAPAPAKRSWIPWAVAGLAVTAALIALLLSPRGSATTSTARAPKFVALNAPEGLRFSEQTADLAVAPDGRSIVVVGNAEDGTVSLYLRRFDDPAWRDLPGTEGAYFPFWSPDGRWVGFFAGSKLKKVAIAGGGAESICDAAAGRGGTWNKDGVIVFSPGNFGPLMQVKAEGGRVTAVTTVDTARGEVGHRFPLFLPDGNHFLYATIPTREDGHEIYLASLTGKERTLVLDADALPSFVPPDRLIFPRGKTLYAQSFDPSTGRLSGEVRPIVEAGRASGFMASQASSAAATAVAFSPVVDPGTELTWFSIEGVQGEALPLPSGQYTEARLAPGGTRALTSRFDTSNPRKAGSDLWLVDLTRKSGTRITFDPGFEFAAIWSPDGRSIYYNSNKTGGYLIYRLSAEGAGEPVAISKPKGLSQQSDDVTPDGGTIVFESQEASTGFDLWLLDTTGQKPPTSYLSTPFNEAQAQLSPDGRWLAYLSDESGKNEVYVQSFPVAGSKIQVSNGGARHPHWRPDGKRLMFLAPDESLMSCDVTLGTAVKVEPPVKLFRFPRDVQDYDMTADGKRLLATMSKSDAAGRSIGVILDF